MSPEFTGMYTVRMRTCTKCKTSKDSSEFYLGSTQRGNWCKECYKIYVKAYEARCKQEIQDWKESTPCADCGQTYPHYVMEFDHLKGRPKGKDHFAGAKTSIPRLLAKMEAYQVELVCSNCHSARTYHRRIAQSTQHHGKRLALQ